MPSLPEALEVLCGEGFLLSWCLVLAHGVSAPPLSSLELGTEGLGLRALRTPSPSFGERLRTKTGLPTVSSHHAFPSPARASAGARHGPIGGSSKRIGGSRSGGATGTAARGALSPTPRLRNVGLAGVIGPQLVALVWVFDVGVLHVCELPHLLVHADRLGSASA